MVAAVQTNLSVAFTHGAQLTMGHCGTLIHGAATHSSCTASGQGAAGSSARGGCGSQRTCLVEEENRSPCCLVERLGLVICFLSYLCTLSEVLHTAFAARLYSTYANA